MIIWSWGFALNQALFIVIFVAFTVYWARRLAYLRGLIEERRDHYLRELGKGKAGAIALAGRAERAECEVAAWKKDAERLYGLIRQREQTINLLREELAQRQEVHAAPAGGHVHTQTMPSPDSLGQPNPHLSSPPRSGG